MEIPNKNCLSVEFLKQFLCLNVFYVFSIFIERPGQLGFWYHIGVLVEQHVFAAV